MSLSSQSEKSQQEGEQQLSPSYQDNLPRPPLELAGREGQAGGRPPSLPRPPLGAAPTGPGTRMCPHCGGAPTAGLPAWVAGRGFYLREAVFTADPILSGSWWRNN